MSDEEAYEYRYVFLVRQQFNKEPSMDSFYQLTVPPGLSGDQARIMVKLNPDFCRNEIRQDNEAMKGMSMRMRFNTDMFQNICMVKTTSPISATELDSYVKMKCRDGELDEFLNESKIAV